MNLAETADAITDYLLDDRFKQAVLINGDWGTGSHGRGGRGGQTGARGTQ